MGLPMPVTEPVTLQDLLATIALGSSLDLEPRATALMHLSTVAHHSLVKDAVVAQPEVMRQVAVLTMDIAAASIRWEILMCVGELCRREEADAGSNVASATVDRYNARASQAALYFAGLEWFPGALRDIVAAEAAGHDAAQAADIARDLLEALPWDGEKAWTKAAQQKCKDLLFIDPRYSKIDYAPFVTRASRFTCIACSKESQKGEDGTRPAYNRCASCKAVFYCSADCQRAHWKAAHKHPCNVWKQVRSDGFKRVDGANAAWTAFFYENRAFLFMNRSDVHRDVAFDDYFMKYQMHSL